LAGAANGDLAFVDWGAELDVASMERRRQANGWRYQIAGTNRIIEPAYGLIDAGYDSNTVWDLCAAEIEFWVPVRGTEARYGAWVRGSVRSHPTLDQFVYVDKTLKDDFYDRRIKQGKGGRILLPADAGELGPRDNPKYGTLLTQLKGQQRDGATGKWKKVPNDHWGDCGKYGVLDQWIRSALASTASGIVDGAVAA
jgi:hypothetical protein